MSGKQLSISICVPSLDDWEQGFGQCLQKLLMFCAQNPFPDHPPGRYLGLESKRGASPSFSREEFIQAARDRGDTHILCLDADQTFPPDTLHRLLAHRKPIVACNIATKQIPSIPTARSNDGTPFGLPVSSEMPKRGLEKIWRVGLAVALVEIDATRCLGEGLFEVRWQRDTRNYYGEDWSFCRKCEEHGVPIYLDHDLSRQVGHIGRYIYTHKDVLPAAMAEELLKLAKAA